MHRSCSRLLRPVGASGLLSRQSGRSGGRRADVLLTRLLWYSFYSLRG